MHIKKKSTVQLARTTTTTTTVTSSIESSISTNNLRAPTLVNNRVLHFPRTSPSTNANNSNSHRAGQGTSNTRSTTDIAVYEKALPIPQSIALHQLRTELGHLKSHHEETLKLIEKRDAIRLRLAILDIEAEQKRQRLLEDHEKQQQRQEELKKQLQYCHQDHHKEPVHVLQANTVQYPQANELFGQQQPDYWY